MLTLADILKALTEKDVILTPQSESWIRFYSSNITDAVIDSRNAIPGSLFVVFKGENVDGHDYVKDAFQSGATIALIQRDLSNHFPVLDIRRGLNLEDINHLAPELPFCLLVEDTIKSLQEIARYWRNKLDLRVIGITGSVGKSTTKEVVADVLDQRYCTLKNVGNLNNEIGLPLTLLRSTELHERAVLEMGFYVPGEIAFLCDLAQPSIGVITNVGTVHAERAGSQEIIAKGKSELVQSLPRDGYAILNYDDNLVRQMADKTQAKVFFYGLDPRADLWASEIESQGLEGISLILHYHDNVIPIRTPLIGRHSVYTALRAAAVGLVECLTWEEIKTGLLSCHAQLRHTSAKTSSGALILDDTYNASPESTLAALDLLADLKGQKIAVLGDMLELGPYEENGHALVGKRVSEFVDELITVGRRAHMIAQSARVNGLAAKRIFEYEDSLIAAQALQRRFSENDVVLVKGSRGVHMERIIDSLELIR
jgi:UDP-N-acetylmuramoyl-tripeptide--D-alanyl-D-alanine ligase